MPLAKVESFTLSPASDRVLAAGWLDAGDKRWLSIVSMELTGTAPFEPRQIKMPQSLRSVTFSPDGTRVCTLNDQGQLELWDPATWRLVKKGPDLAGSRSTYFIDMQFIDSVVAVRLASWKMGPAAETLVWNLERDEVTTRTGQFYLQVGLGVSHGVLVDHKSGAVNWDPTTDRARFVAVPTKESQAISRCSPDGRLLAGCWDYFAGLFDAETLQPDGALLLHPAVVTDLAFSPDGKVLATASKDGFVRLWDLATRQELQALGSETGPARGIDDIRFSHDGSYLVGVRDVAGRESELIFWSSAMPGEPVP